MGAERHELETDVRLEDVVEKPLIGSREEPGNVAHSENVCEVVNCMFDSVKYQPTCTFKLIPLVVTEKNTKPPGVKSVKRPRIKRARIRAKFINFQRSCNAACCVVILTFEQLVSGFLSPRIQL